MTNFVFLLLPCVCIQTARSETQRFLAVFSGGQRAEGQHITGWHVVDGSPRLDTTPLRDPHRPLLWLRDRHLDTEPTADSSTGLIEFTGGDQLPGQVVAYVAASESGTPAHLLVHTTWDVNNPAQPPKRTVRVMLDHIRAIDWGVRSRGPFVARQIRLRTGRRISYRRLVWQADSLRILTDDGVEHISFDNMSHLQLPSQDPWEAYCQQLAVLCPEMPTRIVRLETTAQLIATTSQQRYGAIAVVPPDERRMAQIQLARLEPRRKPLLLRQKIEQTRFQQKLTSVKRKHDQQLRKLDNDLRNMRRRMRNATEAEIERKTSAFSQQAKQRIARQMETLTKNYQAMLLRNMKRHTDRLDDLDKQIQQIKQDHQSLATAGSRSERWKHMAQPAWSLDPLWMRFDSIRTRWSFAAHEVPLSIIAPAEIKQRSALGYSWLWRANRNTHGGVLQSSGQEYGWGFGVHATNELHFAIPAYAIGFRTHVALDDIADRGGCVRARIHLNSVATTRPIFQTDPIVGSDNVIDSGWLSLRQFTPNPQKLILVIDALEENHPPHADPLDIRDHADWLEPTLKLDPIGLQNAVLKQVGSAGAEHTPQQATRTAQAGHP